MVIGLRRMRDFEEIMDAERAAVLDRSVAEPKAVFESAILNKAAKAVCGATHVEIHQWINEATLTLHERQDKGVEISEAEWDQADDQDEERLAFVGRDMFDEPAHRSDAEILEFYRIVGWDPTNEYGQILRIAPNLIFPFLAAAKGAGPARFPEEGVETARLWAEKLAQRPKLRTVPKETVPITEEERQSRNAAARNSNVWRPAKRGQA